MAHRFDARSSVGLPQTSCFRGEYVPHAYGEHDANDREMNHVNVWDQRWMAFGQEIGRVEALPTYGSCGLMQQFSNTNENTLLRYGATSETVLNEGTSIPGSRLRDNGMPKSSHPSAQLTVFYAGTVCVYDNVPAAKAQALMQLAESGQRLSVQKPTYPSQAQYLPQDFWFATAHNHQIEKDVSIPGHESIQELRRLHIPCQAMVPKALPIARKASLARFLEKRKERLMAPYLMREKRLASTMHYGLMEGGDENEGNNPGFNMRNADENSWYPIGENSQQVSECESAT